MQQSALVAWRHSCSRPISYSRWVRQMRLQVNHDNQPTITFIDWLIAVSWWRGVIRSTTRQHCVTTLMLSAAAVTAAAAAATAVLGSALAAGRRSGVTGGFVNNFLVIFCPRALAVCWQTVCERPIQLYRQRHLWAYRTRIRT